MLDLLRSHPTTLALGVVGWLTYQALTGTVEKAKAGEAGELPVVTAEAVALRPLDGPVAEVRNPFPALATDGLFTRAVDPVASGTGGKDGKPGAEGEDLPPEPVIVIERRPAFELRLDSIFAFGADGGHARINGQDVHLGQSIGGCDPESPPVLLELGGLSARVEHRGQEYDLHLDLMPRLSLGGEVIRHELPAVAPGDESTGTDAAAAIEVAGAEVAAEADVDAAAPAAKSEASDG